VTNKKKGFVASAADFHGLNSSQWPVKRVAEIPGDVVIGGLHMIHEREDAIICGPVMPQGGLQARMNFRFLLEKAEWNILMCL
jgi:hypothetical protein